MNDNLQPVDNNKNTIVIRYGSNRYPKFTPVKKKKFLTKLADNNFNITKACQYVGIDRRTYYDHLESDLKFKESVDQVQQFLTDQIVDTSFTVALQPKREGYNDRRLMLEGFHPNFKKQPEVQINQQFNIKVENAMPELKRILDKIQPNNQVEEADFNEID